jgi:hypothetical protein
MPRKAASPHPDSALTPLARAALVELTPEDTFVDSPTIERAEGVATLHYPCTLPGYPGWAWTVAVSDVEGLEPTVLELELLPGEGALLSPDWVPWADRLEEYLLHEKEALASAAAADDDEEDDEDADDDFDDDVDDEVDGVDIDQLDLELDPSPLEVPGEPNDVFDHVEFDEPDPLDP